MPGDFYKEILMFHFQSMRENISQVRNWVYQLFIVGAGSMAFIFPTLEGLSNPKLFWIGSAFIWADLLFALGYQLQMLSKENNELANQAEQMKDGTFSWKNAVEASGVKKASARKNNRTYDIIFSYL